MTDSKRDGTESASRVGTALLGMAVLAPVIAAFAILWMQGYAAPYQDDYHALLAFAGDYEQLHSVKDKVLLVAAAQHTDYKLVFEHSVVAVELELTHRLSFQFLNSLGDLFLLPIGWMLWLVYGGRERSMRARLAHFLPASLIFFGLAYWETMNWAMAVLQNLPVIFFSLLSLYLLAGGDGLVEAGAEGRRFEVDGVAPLAQKGAKDGSRAHLGWACLAGAMAAFSSANGFLVAVVGVWILLRRRAYGACVAWCGSFVIPLVAYRYHYVAQPQQGSSIAVISRPLEVFAFLGMAGDSFWGALLAGFAVAAVLVWALRTGYGRENPVGVYWTIWMVLSGLPVAWMRGSNGVAVASRYSIYSCMLLVFCYAFLADRAAKRRGNGARWFYAAALVGATAFCIGQDLWAYTKLAERNEMTRRGMAHYMENPALNSPLVDPFIIVVRKVPGEEEYERRELTRAMESGVYRIKQ